MSLRRKCGWLRSLFRKRELDAAMDAELQFHVEMQAAEIFFRELMERVRGAPGVEAVCGVSMIPDRGSGWPTEYYRTDRPVPPVGEQPRVSIQSFTPEYLKTYGIPLLKGRDFSESDSANAPKVLLINQAFADLVFPGEDPVGFQIHCAGLREIIGVIANVKNSGLADETKPAAYVPYTQWQWPSCYLTVHARGDLKALPPVITNHVRALNPNQPLAPFRTMAEYLDQTTARPRFHSMLLGFLAMSALVLAAVGIYGVMAVSVAQRTQKMGVRLALGAKKSDLVFLILKRGMRLTFLGLIIGVVCSVGLTRVLSSQLYGVTANDPFTFVVVTVLLAEAAALACLIPARRAANVDPIVALRYE